MNNVEANTDMAQKRKRKGHVIQLALSS